MQYTPLAWYAAALPKGEAVSFWLKILPVLTTLLFFAAQWLNRTYKTQITEILVNCTYCFLGFIFILFSFSVILIYANVIIKLLHIARPSSLTLVRLALGAAVLCSVFAFINAHRTPKVKTIAVSSPLMQDGKEIKIIQLSDMHLGESVSVGQLERLVKKIEDIKPDLLLFTGDIFEHSNNKTERFIELVKSMSAPLGKFGVLGNHEYYRGGQRSEDFFAKSGIELIKNSSRKTGPFNIIGVNDIRTTNLSKENFVKIIKENVKADHINILLSHTPYYFDEADALGVNLMLSGHTHRGQIWPFEYLNHIYFDDVYGPRKGKEGGLLYVTSGAFYWGPPMRFLTDNEIPLIAFSKENKQRRAADL